VRAIMPNRVFHADNREWLRAQADRRADLIYVDAPYGTGRGRSGRQAQHTFHDSWSGSITRFIEFLADRVEQCHRILKLSGSIYVHLDWHAVHYAKVMMDEVFGARNFLNEIIWSYRTGGNCRQWFPRKHDTLLLYARQLGQHTLHPIREGRFRTDGLNYDVDGRPYTTTLKGRVYFDPRGPLSTDVWELPFLSTVSAERTGYPTQKPEALLRRVIGASSNVGDVVMDPFCGSGTALVVAKQMGRRWVGCDSNRAAVELTRRRLRRTRVVTR
jgi:DNA modification methylase